LFFFIIREFRVTRERENDSQAQTDQSEQLPDSIGQHSAAIGLFGQRLSQ
jgi:hypothetical protein